MGTNCIAGSAEDAKWVQIVPSEDPEYYLFITDFGRNYLNEDPTQNKTSNANLDIYERKTQIPRQRIMCLRFASTELLLGPHIFIALKGPQVL